MYKGVNRLLLVLCLLLLVFQNINAVSLFEGEEYAVFEQNQLKGLADKKGHVVIPPEYEELGWTTGEIYLLENVIGFKKNGLWGLVNLKNERVTEPLYTSLTRFNESLIVASKKLPYNSSIVYGVINARGKAEIAFNYLGLKVNDSHLVAMKFENNHYVHGVLNAHGDVIIGMDCDEVEPLTPTLYLATKDNRKAIYDAKGNNLTGFSLDSLVWFTNDYFQIFNGGKKGLISSDGVKLILPQYKELIIENGKIHACKFSEWQSFDEKNNVLASFSYDEIEPRGEGIYRVRIGEAEGLVNSKDSLIAPFSNAEILEHFGPWITIRKNGKYGVLRTDGSVFLPAEFDSIKYENNLFLVRHKREGKRGWSLVNPSGDYVSSQLYNSIQWIGDSYFKVQRDKYWGVINRNGVEKIYCKYDTIMQYTEGKLLVKFMGEDGILNMDGSWEVIPQKKEIEIVDPIRYLVRSPYGSFVAYYPETMDFTAEYFLYKSGSGFLEKTNDNKYGLRNADGDRVIKPEYTAISELYEDSIYIAQSEKGYSFITRCGKIVVSEDSRFEESKGMSEEFVGVKIDGKWGFVDINSKLRVTNQYENVGLYHEGLAPVKILRRWGYINKAENLIVQPVYDTVYTFHDGFCEVVKKGKYGLINAKGELVVDCEYDTMQRINTGGYLIIKDNKIGLVGKAGRLMILPRFDAVADLNNGFVIASRNGKYGLYSNDGVSIIPMIYDALIYDSYKNSYLAANSPVWVNLE